MPATLLFLMMSGPGCCGADEDAYDMAIPSEKNRAIPIRTPDIFAIRAL
jgi:hypothetical protein